MNNMTDYLNWCKGTPKGKASSVRYGLDNKRFMKANEEAGKDVVELDKIEQYCIEIQKLLGFSNPKAMYVEVKDIDYEEIKKKFFLDDIRDILWIKFTTDNYIGVVAASNDINFDRPKTVQDYTKKNGRKWIHNTSGIILHHLNKFWNEKTVLIIPLSGIPKGLKRGDVERALGNYLISKKVPILDFYSHNY